MSILGNNLLAEYYAQNQYGARIPAMLGYVTDGLVAMWDGEYNAGNKHNPDATSWKDCVGGVVLPHVGYETYEWLDKCCHFLGTSGYGGFVKESGTSVTSQPVATIEICRSWETITGSNLYAAPNCTFRCQGLQTRLPKSPTVLVSVYCPVYQRNSGFSNLTTRRIFTHVARSTSTDNPSSTLSAWQDGVAATRYIYSGSMSDDYNNIIIGGNPLVEQNTLQGGAARVYCCRAYNRALSEAEIIQNHAADLSRFGTDY